jgi:hypothetical protein
MISRQLGALAVVADVIAAIVVALWRAAAR